MPDGGEAHGPRARVRAAGQRRRRRSRPRPASAVSRPSGADGSLVLRHQTSERTLARLEGAAAARRHARWRRRPTRSTCLADGSLTPFVLDNPHPEVSWRTLFGKVWYEGYAQPEYVWQSTGATDDFESKLSLVPADLRHDQGHALRDAVRGAARGAGGALHVAVRPPDHQGEDQADGRDHGGAAERRHRVPGGAVPGRRSSRGTWWRSS